MCLLTIINYYFFNNYGKSGYTEQFLKQTCLRLVLKNIYLPNVINVNIIIHLKCQDRETFF